MNIPTPPCRQGIRSLLMFAQQIFPNESLCHVMYNRPLSSNCMSGPVIMKLFQAILMQSAQKHFPILCEIAIYGFSCGTFRKSIWCTGIINLIKLISICTCLKVELNLSNSMHVFSIPTVVLGWVSLLSFSLPPCLHGNLQLFPCCQPYSNKLKHFSQKLKLEVSNIVFSSVQGPFCSVR